MIRFALTSLFTFAALAAQAEVTVKDAWVRGTVAGQKSSGAFLTLTSPSWCAARTSPRGWRASIPPTSLAGMTYQYACGASSCGKHENPADDLYPMLPLMRLETGLRGP